MTSTKFLHFDLTVSAFNRQWSSLNKLRGSSLKPSYNLKHECSSYIFFSHSNVHVRCKTCTNIFIYQCLKINYKGHLPHSFRYYQSCEAKWKPRDLNFHTVRESGMCFYNLLAQWRSELESELPVYGWFCWFCKIR